MRLILKPLFGVELPPEFVEILKSKLKGREVKEGETIEIDLLGKSLSFKVVYAEPKEFKVDVRTKIELTEREVVPISFEFEEPVKDVIPFEKGLVMVFENEVLILNQEGHKIFNMKFEKITKIVINGNVVTVVHNDKKLTIIRV